MKLKSQIQKIDPFKLKMKNGKSYAQVLKEEVVRLRNCIQNRLDEYMYSHPAKIYERTGRFQSSLRVEDFVDIKVVGTVIILNVYFDESGYHRSGDGLYGWNSSDWQSNGETVNTAYLLNYGYQVKQNVWFKDIKNFGYREGAYFIENGIADFQLNNPYGIRIKINNPKKGYRV
jgi:uncharacterized secreted protein with C-terminal beta-propeller domain